MRRIPRVTVLALVSLLPAACAEPGQPTAPMDEPSLARHGGGVTARGGTERLVNMMDACDPTTFNIALQNPTACVRRGGVTFQRFLAQVEAHHKAGAWHFAPSVMHVRVGQTLVAVNRGGEEHTFTEVEEFGGGVVPLLNTLSGNPVEAPECLALDADDIVAPGGRYTDEVEEPGTERYQCCIHPWMRTVVHAR